MTLVGDAKRAYQRKWLTERRASWFSDKSCAVCGTTKNLELDHIDPTTKVSHNIWSWSESRRLEELSKCQVLCNVHHEQKTIEFLTKRFCPQGHDTLVVGRDKYGSGKSKTSRCSECRRIKDRKR